MKLEFFTKSVSSFVVYVTCSRHIHVPLYFRMLVKMDDNIIKHYSNESTFIISITKTEEPTDSAQVIDVTLSEIDMVWIWTMWRLSEESIQSVLVMGKKLLKSRIHLLCILVKYNCISSLIENVPKLIIFWALHCGHVCTVFWESVCYRANANALPFVKNVKDIFT